MESMKQKLGILAIILCLALIAAGIWYLVVGLPNSRIEMEGTLVEGLRTIEKMILV